ncbi:perlucin-like [Boleophthalmus pectinirostris]|uniref:perlucin-like n=1 Tax=Boleophthalmus pectinirostris TaxID=150288 RepID=UPI002432350F|nr:perlucin-like [Boleophthalmus pectinirostris]
MRAHLVVFNNKAEEQYVARITNGLNIWIGLSAAQQYGSWFWVNSDALGYTNWCPRKPSPKSQKKSCAAKQAKCWTDRVCAMRLPFVCEREESDTSN